MSFEHFVIGIVVVLNDVALTEQGTGCSLLSLGHQTEMIGALMSYYPLPDQL